MGTKPKFKEMEFSLIISNPPYSGLDIKILKSVMGLGEKLVFVMPSSFILAEKGRDLKFLSEIDKRLVSVDMIDANEAFKIQVPYPVSVLQLDKSRTEKILFTDEKKNVKYEVDSVTKLSKYGANSEIYESVKAKIRPLLIRNLQSELLEHSPEMTFGIAAARGNIGCDDFYTFCMDDFSHHCTKKYTYGWKLETDVERRNFFQYLKNKTTRFCLSVYKDGMGLHRREMEFVPWLDFTKDWTDDSFAKHIGLTEEELSWMQSVIPAYYPEDKPQTSNI